MKTASLSFCITCIIVCCQTALLLAAPTARRTKRTPPDAKETKLSLIFNSMADEPELLEGADVHSRNKRHAVQEENLEVDLTLPGEQPLSPSVRRRRSTAVFYLHASLAICNKYPSYCRRIEVDEGDVRLKLRLEDE